MRETSKSSKHATRQALYEQYIRGPVGTFGCKGFDIGCGRDRLPSENGRVVFGVDSADVGDTSEWTQVADAQGWKGFEDELDFVYSSHCLEHMRDVPMAIKNWSHSIRKSGILFLVVPDFVLYERMQWPSRYNDDHKAAFSLFAIDPTRRPEKLYGFAEMKAIGDACGLELVHAEIEAHGYEFGLLNYTFIDQTAVCDACANCIFIYKKL